MTKNPFFICILIFYITKCTSRQPEDWSLSWGGTNTIYGWGHNHRGQLGGVEGAKVKVPTLCEALSALRPVQIVGGEQTLLAVTSDGKVYATGSLFISYFQAS